MVLNLGGEPQALTAFDIVSMDVDDWKRFRALAEQAEEELRRRTGPYGSNAIVRDHCYADVLVELAQAEAQKPELVTCPYCQRPHYREALALADRTTCRGCGAVLPL